MSYSVRNLFIKSSRSNCSLLAEGEGRLPTTATAITREKVNPVIILSSKISLLL